jgi:glycosyltransferase involved in cell wall biosynthesis
VHGGDEHSPVPQRGLLRGENIPGALGNGNRREGRPLQILFATARYLPERGGTEIHTREVARRLAQRGAQVTVAATVRRGAFERESHQGSVRVVRVRAWPANRDYYVAPALAGVIRESQADIVHCQGYHTLVAPLVMFEALRAQIPYIITLHSGGHSSRLRHRLRPAQAWLMRPLLTRARRIVAVSPYEAELFARRLHLPREAFAVIPSGVDLPLAPQTDSQSGPPLILSLGRLERYKGHQRMLDALPVLSRARPGIRLRIVGSGPYERRLRRLAERLGVLDLVEIGPVPADERTGMARLLSQAAAVASLSDYESQGLAIQEALALGTPLVVSHGTALAELARYPNVRALKRRADREAIAAAVLELLDAPRAQAPLLPTWDECAAALLELYEETLAKSS